MLSALPAELVLSCLALVSTWDHAALSLVSKRFRTLVTSHELYKTRSLIGRTDKRYYVCISLGTNDKPPLWIIVLRPENITSTVNRVIRLPSLPCQPKNFSSFVTLDYGIYVIGGVTDIYNPSENRTSDVWLLDCRTNTWHQLPSMRVARASPAAGVVDGKIYVFGGCNDVNSLKLNWGEVFDPETQTWDTLAPLPNRSVSDNLIYESFVMEEKVYAVKWGEESFFRREGSHFYYLPSEGKWGRTNMRERKLCHYCVVDDLLFGVDVSLGHMFWCECKSDELKWKQVKGLEDLQMTFISNRGLSLIKATRNINQVSSFGLNNIVLLWLDHSLNHWCAEISFERHKEKGEIWGTIESKAVTTSFSGAPLFYHAGVLCSTSVNL